MATSEELNDSIGLATSPTWLDCKVVSSPESDEASENLQEDPLVLRVPSLVDELLDEMVDPTEVKDEPEDLLLDPDEARRQLEHLVGSQGAVPSKR